MNKSEQALSALAEMDELAARQSPIHRLHPIAKLLVTIAYIFTVVSFGKYQLSGLAVMALYPVLLFQLSGIPAGTCFHKLRIVLPLVMAVGLFNPFFDRSPLLYLGTVPVSGGVISMLSLMVKGVLCLTASFLLIAATPIDSLCAALRRLHVPSLLVTLLLLTYRYVGVMTEEVSIMTDAYRLRAPGQKGIHISAWGSFLGQLGPGPGALRQHAAAGLPRPLPLRGGQPLPPHRRRISGVLHCRFRAAALCECGRAAGPLACEVIP